MDDPSVYLAGKGIETFRANGQEITAHCWFCPDGDPKGRGKLYLNTETWLYHCKRCDTKGNRRTLLTHFGDTENIEYLPGQDPARIRAVLSEATAVAHEMLLANDAMLEYLVGRGLSANTITDAQYGYVPRNHALSDRLNERYHRQELIGAGLLSDAGREFFSGKITIPYQQHGSVVQLRAKDPKGKYFTPAGHPVRLYGTDDLAGADDVIVTEGEFDRDILRQTLQLSTDVRMRSLAVVGLPGANAWPAGFETYFTEARRVYVAFDPDDTGRKSAIKAKELLGSKARIVELPGVLPKCDWTEFLRPKGTEHPHGGHGLADVQELLATAAGRRLWSVSDAQVKWRRQKSEAAGIKMGFAEVDAWFSPGMEPGDVVFVLAKTGCLQGDAMIGVNRGGKGFQMRLDDLVTRFNGGSLRAGRKWDLSQPTYVQREVGGIMRLARLKAAWCSGVKRTYTVTTETGRTLRATDEHPFLTDRGWSRLDGLLVGKDRVHVLAGHRMDSELVVSVEPYGEEVTYDLEVEDDPHCFIANGFVVHNTGKTNFLTTLARNTLAVPTLFISLEMTAAQIYERLQRGYRFFHPYVTDDEISEAMSLLRIVDENRLAEGDISRLCDEYADEVGIRPRQVLLDYLGYYAKGCRGSGAYEKTTNAAMTIKAEAKNAGVSIVAPHQVNRTAEDGRPLDADSARDSGAVEETADLLLSLYRPDQAIAPTQDSMPSCIVRVGCLKNRKGGKGGVTSLVFSAASLVLVDQGTTAARKAEEESRLIWRGETYESIFRAQTTRQLKLVN